MERNYNNREIGAKYEKMAADYLRAQGMCILECNYSNKFGEIDIIAKDNIAIVFVEVKYRKTEGFGNPLEAINLRKQNKIRNVAKSYIHEKNLYNSYIRFDAISILGDRLTHIKDAF